MDESLLPREIPAGGVGTCRLDFSDIDIDSDDRRGMRWGDVENGGMMGRERGRKGSVYICCRWLKSYTCGGPSE